MSATRTAQHLESARSSIQQPYMPPAVQRLLRCPICRRKLNLTGEEFVCANLKCKAHFPIVDGIPILINEQSSVFSVDDFISRRSTTYNLRRNKIKKMLHSVIPSLNRNVMAKVNYEKLTGLLFAQSNAPRVLVIGGRTPGAGMEPLILNGSLELVEIDVSFGPRTMLICDAHDIPFEDESFNGVIVQAVLEHVVDPYRCVDEIHRVLKRDGVVYAETPFLQQVHMGPYDFTRFTHLGHRRLFRKFDEVASGAACGPGMALAWSYQYFLTSFAESKLSRAFFDAFSKLTSFYLKYFDGYLIDKQGTLDAASGYYFMGRKGTRILSDRELIKLYKGAIRF